MMTRKEFWERFDKLKAIEDPALGKAARVALHREYYAQFVDEGLLATVESNIGIMRIANSDDPHFNDIPLKKWDMLALTCEHALSQRLREVGDFWSLVAGTCILKEAADQLRERAK